MHIRFTSDLSNMINFQYDSQIDYEMAIDIAQYSAVSLRAVTRCDAQGLQNIEQELPTNIS